MSDSTELASTYTGLMPFSLRDAPALIERVFPAQKVGVEAQKERKAGAGQTLTALGSYWKGRKPLVLVRACVLASLLPATDDPAGDVELFEALMRMDPEGISRRGANVSAQMVADCRAISEDAKVRHLIRSDENGPVIPAKWLGYKLVVDVTKIQQKAIRAGFDEERESIRRVTLVTMSFSQQVGICERVERLEKLHDKSDPLYAGVMARANARLGTSARTLPELIEQLGIARFGHRPVVGDPFCGGGSIPFESARMGCDVVASDLNPVACMLTWGALNIIGADEAKRAEIAAEQARVAEAVDAEIIRLGIEHNKRGDRAKAYLYCLETVDPQTGWRVPMAPSWVISQDRRCVAKMMPVHAEKRFNLVVFEGASAEEMAQATLGSVREGHLVYRLDALLDGNEKEYRIPISRLRGDGEGSELLNGRIGNRVRPWTISEVSPIEPKWNSQAKPVINGSSLGAWVGGDIWLERLYCIQWTDGEDLKADRTRPRTFFAAPDEDDIRREKEVQEYVERNILLWQESGFVPNMMIEGGVETDKPIKNRGWTYWHHLFGCRSINLLCSIQRHYMSGISQPEMSIGLARALSYSAKLCIWDSGFGSDKTANVFTNQSLNTLYNWGNRGFKTLYQIFSVEQKEAINIYSQFMIHSTSSLKASMGADIWVYDPPYADAVLYHEITEFFIAWLRRNPPPPFDKWTWDSRRPLAIQGKGEKFRSDMVDAFRTMSEHMPDNGTQTCMFTHQDAGVWADMAGIVWAAGLRVTAAWYVSTETMSELKQGGYVQGTVLLVLRKRQGDERAYKDELVLEVRGAVQRQVDLLTGLNQKARRDKRDENPFSDADLQMAGYAAAMEVLTGYTHIDGMDMTREAMRPRVKGERGVIEEMIALAVQTATELMRPADINEAMWEKLAPTERFWLKMTEAESTRPAGQPQGRLDDYQNFAKAYRADGWQDLMADRTPNKARVKTASEFKRMLMSGHPFSDGLLRPVLYAMSELKAAVDKEEDHAVSGDRILAGLRENLKPWSQHRQSVSTMAEWLGRTLHHQHPKEATSARTLAGLIRTERLT